LRALITGIAGFAGSHLAETLLAITSWKIYGIIHSGHGNIAHLRKQVVLFPADLRDLQAVISTLKEIRPDYVFHLAAQSLVPSSWQDPWATLETNIHSQLNLFQALIALGMGPRILVVGSGDEYGLIGPGELPIRETNPLRPYNPYAVSKVAQDMLALQYFLSHSLAIVRVRPFNHLGPRQSPAFVAAAFAKQIAEAEAGLGPGRVRVGSLEPRRDFSDVRDIVRGYHLAMAEGEAGEVYNLGSEQAHSIRQLLEILMDLSTVPLDVEEDPSILRPVEVPLVVSDCTKFRQRTGWQASIPLRETLCSVLEYWREEVAGGR